MPGRDTTLPRAFELLLGKDQQKWPLEARFLDAAFHGDVRGLKKIARELDAQGKGIPVTVANTTYLGMNALHAVSGKGKLPAYQYLVEEIKMDVNKPDTTRGFTPLEHAITHGHLPAVRYLVDHGADLRHRRSNVTLLHTAAMDGYSEIAKFLLSRGADVDAESPCGTPLSLAAYSGYASTVKILLDHNADILIQAGANVNSVGTRYSPLQKATAKGLTEAMKCLLEAGANANVPDTFGRMPIELAAEYGTQEDVEILFPFTSPIPTIANWSVNGVISHVQLEIKQLEDDNIVKKRKSGLKQQGDEAFKEEDFLNASKFYTQALKVDHFDAKLLSNRSLCWLRMGDGERALDDASKCRERRPKWAKAHYRLGAALMFVKDYDQAYSALSHALELDPESEEIKKLFWEAMELKS